MDNKNQKNNDQKNNELTGSCLCGKVRYRYSGKVKVFQYCHCTRCQKYTGSAHASNIIGDPADFAWTSGEELVGRYEIPDAKYFATSFCKSCGSALPWMTKTKGAVIIPAGTLDVDPGVKPIHNIYLANRAPWYVDPEKLLKYQELPVKPEK